MHTRSVSIIIPTLNSEKTLSECLTSIYAQDFPQENLEILIIDAGSIDNTLNIVRRFENMNKIKITIFDNPLLTGEAGKAVGFKNSNNEFIAFLDSDNLLPDNGWLRKMMQPFKDQEIIASEPLEFTYRKKDCFFTRYCALIGMNDPLCLFLGNYDRYSILTGKWTQMPHKEEDVDGYLKIELDSRHIPTIGANGFLIRRSALRKCNIDKYLFDIDISYELFKSAERVRIAKVKTGIIHIFSENLQVFSMKQRRRIKDYLYYNRLGIRRYPWKNVNKLGLANFLISCMTVFPLLLQSFKGYLKKSDSAWFFHPLACWITLFEYGRETLIGIFVVHKPYRVEWRQYK